MNFIDECRFTVEAGNGGNGVVAFRREKFVPRGGPAGGDGGRGGSVWLVGDRNLNTLYHLRMPKTWRAERGRHGEGSNRTGRSGEDLEIAVPLGTVVFEEVSPETEAEPDAEDLAEEPSEQQLAHQEALASNPFLQAGDGSPEDVDPEPVRRSLGEVIEDGQRLLVAQGGKGGKGNAHFSTATRQTPRFAQDGQEGEARQLLLELKLLADVGVVGLPNAGKSTLISVLTAARPKVADYPFTTLVPQLGVVAPASGADPFVIADLPGLIAGAAAGAGLGHRFLRHVERCRVLLHLVDLSWGEQPANDELAVIEEELAAFAPDLLERPRIVVGSKIDAVDGERQEALRKATEERGLPYRELSSVTGRGLRPLVDQVVHLLDELRQSEREAEEERAVRFVTEEEE